MVTLVYICGSCKGDIQSRTFEVEYADVSEAGSSSVPPCPTCKKSRSVTRYFGHNIYSAPKKKASCIPSGYKTLENSEKKAVVSLGVRVDDEEERKAVQHTIEELTGGIPVEDLSDADVDVTETRLGLKKGTMDRAMFDMRQKKMFKELAEGKKVSGFYLPLTGDTGN